MYIHIYIYICIYIYTYIFVCLCVRVCVCVRVYIWCFTSVSAASQSGLGLLHPTPSTRHPQAGEWLLVNSAVCQKCSNKVWLIVFWILFIHFLQKALSVEIHHPRFLARTCGVLQVRSNCQRNCARFAVDPLTNLICNVIQWKSFWQ